jgi:hypothetical protein
MGLVPTLVHCSLRTSASGSSLDFGSGTDRVSSVSEEEVSRFPSFGPLAFPSNGPNL